MAKVVADYPKLLNIWDFELNTLDINKAAARSNEEAYWYCHTCGYKWSSTIHARVRSTGKCPCHEIYLVVVKGINDVLTTHPHLKKWFIPSDNLDVDIYSLSSRSNVQIIWHCPKCEYKWPADLTSRANSKDECPCCEQNMATLEGYNDLLTLNPEADEIYDYKANDALEINIKKLRPNSHTSVFWRCKKCKHQWIAQVDNTLIKKCKCPECNPKAYQKSVHKKPLLVELVPNIRKQFDYKKNKGVELEKLVLAENLPLHWICDKCGHKWSANVKSRVGKKDGKYFLYQCRKCADANSIEPVSSVPILVKFWNFDKNIDKDINKISKHSLEYAFWHCKKCGYDWSMTILGRAVSDQLCPCCEKGIAAKRGFNDVFTVVPELMKLYDWKKNKNIDIYNCTVGSSAMAWWHCPDCGREWSSEISQRVIKKQDEAYRVVGCNNCNRLNARKTSYGDEYPLLKKMYVEELNDRKLSDRWTRAERISKQIYWKCLDCNEIFDSTLNSMITCQRYGNKGCPFCAHTRVRPGESFADMHPKLMKEFSPDNKINPYEYLPGSAEEAIWICKKDPRHTWNATFYLRARGDGNCPYCHQVILNENLNSFAAVYPQYKDIYSKKNKKPVNKIFFNTRYKFKWTCPTCHGDYPASISEIVNSKKKCPFCHEGRILPGFNSFAALFPNIANMLSPKNNFDADCCSPYSKVHALWACSTCGGEYPADIVEMVEGKCECPFCTNKRVLPGFNSLDITHPEISNLWSNNNNRNTNTIMAQISEPYKWICKVCNNEYIAPVNKMVNGESTCPFCINKKVLPGFNSLDVTHPEIAKLWSNNNERTINTVMAESKYNTLWTCPDCCSDYTASPHEMIQGTAKCSYCEKLKNSLAINHSDLMEEWIWVNNYALADPYQISEKSPKKVFWQCKNSPNHRYRQSPASRTMFKNRKREPCPYCKGLRQKKCHFVRFINS